MQLLQALGAVGPVCLLATTHSPAISIDSTPLAHTSTSTVLVDTNPHESIGARLIEFLVDELPQLARTPDVEVPILGTFAASIDTNVEAEPGGWDYPSSLVTNFHFQGEWALYGHGPIDEYRPVGAGAHSISVELLGEVEPRVHAVESGGQVFTLFFSVTVNPTHRDDIDAALSIGASVGLGSDLSFSSGGHQYPAGTEVHRDGDCWKLIGVGLNGCRLYNCKTSGGSKCRVDIGGDSWGSENSCVESGDLDPLVTACQDGITVDPAMPCISGC